MSSTCPSPVHPKVELGRPNNVELGRQWDTCPSPYGAAAARRGPCPFNVALRGASVRSTMNAEPRDPRSEPPPDLQTQLEGVLHAIWAEEERWRREERIDLAVRLVRDA
jgi:hypothetical protein